MSDDKKKKIGALWLNESKSGTKYMKGIIELGDGHEPLKVVIFKNNYKERDAQPDYVMYESTPATGGEPRTTRDDAFEDDVPF